MTEVVRSGLVVHEQIKLRLIRDVLHPETADEEFIKSDRLCEFGKWIYDPLTQRNHDGPEFQRFKAAHRMFHTAAHQALCLAKAGSCQAAFDSIQHGAFEASSKALKATLRDLRRALFCDEVALAVPVRV